LLDIASTAFLGSESHGTPEHILLSLFFSDSPDPESRVLSRGESAGRQLRLDTLLVAEADGKFGHPEKGERPPLEAVTEQRGEDCD
jgi:hypothetical protein